MAYTYDDFLNAANKSGLLPKISESDLNLAKQYPEFGLSILSLTKDIDGATTAEQKLLATEAADQLRSAYSGGTGKYNTQINDLLTQAANYGSFNYGKETEYQRLLNSVTNPEKFNYDLDSDVVWDAYRKQYLREGDRATADTLAKVSAATGGRPSSYAIGAAHQAGDYFRSQLTDMIPTLYQNAYQRYLNDLEVKQAGLDALAADRTVAYNQHMNGYSSLLDTLETLLAQQEQEEENPVIEPPFSDPNKYYNGSVSDSNIRYMQQVIGVAPDGKWGPSSEAAAKRRWGVTSADEAFKKWQESQGGTSPIVPKETENTKKFIASHMTLEQALSRGITRKEWMAMMNSWLNNADFTDEEYAWLEKQYGLV